MKQRLGAVARGFAVTALSGLLAAGGCVSQRANENEATAHGAAVQTSRVTTVNHSRAWNIIRGLRSNMTPRTRYLGPADPAPSYTTGTASIGSNRRAVLNGQNASPSVATNVTGPVSGPAYYIGTGAGTAVNAGVAGTNLTGTAIVPGPVALGNTVVGGMAPGAGVVAEGVAIPAATTGTASANATASATVNPTGTTSAPAGTTSVAGTITAPGVAGPLSSQALNATAPVGIAPANVSNATTGPALTGSAGIAGTVAAPGVAGPVSTRTLTGTANLGIGTPPVVTPGVASNVVTSNATITNRTGGATARVVLRPSKAAASNATVNGTSGARVKLGAMPLAAQRDASGRVVVTNQTVNQQ